MGNDDSSKPEDPKVTKTPEVKSDPPALIGLSPEDQKIIDEIAKDSEVVPDPTVIDGGKGPGGGPVEPPLPVIITPESASVLAVAIVQTVDTSMTLVCKLVAKRSDMDFHMDEKDKKGLIDIWNPVCKKWGDKIPIEVLAILSTISVAGAMVGVAIKNKAPEKK